MNGIEIRKAVGRRERRAFLVGPINRFAASTVAAVDKKYRIFEKSIPSRGA